MSHDKPANRIADELRDLRKTIRTIVSGFPPLPIRGRLVSVNGASVRAELPAAPIGSVVAIAASPPLGRAHESRRGGLQDNVMLRGEVIAIKGDIASISLLTDYQSSVTGLSYGCPVTVLNTELRIRIGDEVVGAVLDPLCRILEEASDDAAKSHRIGESVAYPLRGRAPLPLERMPLDRPLRTGIRVIDTFTPLAVGQRLAVLAEAGVGKSSLLAAVARRTEADITVLALIGERGREVREMLERELPPSVRGRVVTVVSTSDEPPLLRIYAALSATRIAEHFRDQGKDVLLLVDSLTRLCRAYREIGLLAGETPVRRGYPASTYARLPELLERAGRTSRGSISALYTVLLSSELGEDPMVEEIKSLTDGHLVLKRELAHRGIFPAIDIVESLSRLDRRLLDDRQAAVTREIRSLLARYRHDRELLALGGVPDRELKRAVTVHHEMSAFIAQHRDEVMESTDSFVWLERILQMDCAHGAADASPRLASISAEENDSRMRDLRSTGAADTRPESRAERRLPVNQRLKRS